jgi:hypothetical protein
MRLATFLLVAVLPLSAVADDSQLSALFKAKSLRCKWVSGYVGKWTEGTLKVTPDRFDDITTFDSIDRAKGTARLLGNQSAGTVTLILTVAGLTFLDQSPAGSIFLTTVFADSKNKAGDYVAVSSRHFSFFTTVAPSQYHGTCKILE